MSKIIILTLGDHPFSPSGVGIQTKNMVEGLLETGRYSVVSLAGALKHQDATPIVTEKWGDDWKVFPVGGEDEKKSIFGTPEIVRSVSISSPLLQARHCLDHDRSSLVAMALAA